MKSRVQTRLPAGSLVFVGGALGALARGLLDDAAGSTNAFGIGVSTAFVNVVGAFFMGVLVTTWAARRGPNPRWDRAKILLGSGFLGAFTTYATFALAMARATLDGVYLSLFAGAGVVVAGLIGVWLGVLISRPRASLANSEGGSQ
ncbi:MAG: CrcB family protein [Actinomycetaceae bacterium]|nr:CrcB family protein [Actinomycetaceae bacterium]